MNTIYEKYGKLLQRNPLFFDIAPSSFPTLLPQLHAYTKSYKKDEYVKHSGDPANFIGIVLAGEIHVLRDDYDGKRSITASITKGSLFAEAFSCAGISTLPVDIVAADTCIILYLDSHALLRACGGRCEFQHTLIRNLLGIVAKKNMYLNQKIRYLSHKTTAEKILAYLNDQAKQNASNEFTIPFNRQELADYLGVERSAMSAEISKLVKLGILETQRSHFKLLS